MDDFIEAGAIKGARIEHVALVCGDRAGGVGLLYVGRRYSTVAVENIRVLLEYIGVIANQNCTLLDQRMTPSRKRIAHGARHREYIARLLKRMLRGSD